MGFVERFADVINHLRLVFSSKPPSVATGIAAAEELFSFVPKLPLASGSGFSGGEVLGGISPSTSPARLVADEPHARAGTSTSQDESTEAEGPRNDGKPIPVEPSVSALCLALVDARRIKAAAWKELLQWSLGNIASRVGAPIHGDGQEAATSRLLATKETLNQHLHRQKFLLHGQELRIRKRIPKLVHACVARLRAMAISHPLIVARAILLRPLQHQGATACFKLRASGHRRSMSGSDTPFYEGEMEALWDTGQEQVLQRLKEELNSGRWDEVVHPLVAAAAVKGVQGSKSTPSLVDMGRSEALELQQTASTLAQLLFDWLEQLRTPLIHPCALLGYVRRHGFSFNAQGSSNHSWVSEFLQACPVNVRSTLLELFQLLQELEKADGLHTLAQEQWVPAASEVFDVDNVSIYQAVFCRFLIAILQLPKTSVSGQLVHWPFWMFRDTMSRARGGRQAVPMSNPVTPGAQNPSKPNKPEWYRHRAPSDDDEESTTTQPARTAPDLLSWTTEGLYEDTSSEDASPTLSVCFPVTAFEVQTDRTKEPLLMQCFSGRTFVLRSAKRYMYHIHKDEKAVSAHRGFALNLFQRKRIPASSGSAGACSIPAWLLASPATFTPLLQALVTQLTAESQDGADKVASWRAQGSPVFALSHQLALPKIDPPPMVSHLGLQAPPSSTAAAERREGVRRVLSAARVESIGAGGGLIENMATLPPAAVTGLPAASSSRFEFPNVALEREEKGSRHRSESGVLSGSIGGSPVRPGSGTYKPKDDASWKKGKSPALTPGLKHEHMARDLSFFQSQEELLRPTPPSSPRAQDGNLEEKEGSTESPQRSTSRSARLHLSLHEVEHTSPEVRVARAPGSPGRTLNVRQSGARPLTVRVGAQEYNVSNDVGPPSTMSLPVPTLHNGTGRRSYVRKAILHLFSHLEDPSERANVVSSLYDAMVDPAAFHSHMQAPLTQQFSFREAVINPRQDPTSSSSPSKQPDDPAATKADDRSPQVDESSPATLSPPAGEVREEVEKSNASPRTPESESASAVQPPELKDQPVSSEVGNSNSQLTNDTEASGPDDAEDIGGHVWDETGGYEEDATDIGNSARRSHPELPFAASIGAQAREDRIQRQPESAKQQLESLLPPDSEDEAPSVHSSFAPPLPSPASPAVAVGEEGEITAEGSRVETPVTSRSNRGRPKSKRRLKKRRTTSRGSSVSGRGRGTPSGTASRQDSPRSLLSRPSSPLSESGQYLEDRPLTGLSASSDLLTSRSNASSLYESSSSSSFSSRKLFDAEGYANPPTPSMQLLQDAVHSHALPSVSAGSGLEPRSPAPFHSPNYGIRSRVRLTPVKPQGQGAGPEHEAARAKLDEVLSSASPTSRKSGRRSRRRRRMGKTPTNDSITLTSTSLTELNRLLPDDSGDDGEDGGDGGEGSVAGSAVGSARSLSQLNGSQPSPEPPPRTLAPISRPPSKDRFPPLSPSTGSQSPLQSQLNAVPPPLSGPPLLETPPPIAEDSSDTDAQERM